MLKLNAYWEEQNIRLSLKNIKSTILYSKKNKSINLLNNVTMLSLNNWIKEDSKMILKR